MASVAPSSLPSSPPTSPRVSPPVSSPVRPPSRPPAGPATTDRLAGTDDQELLRLHCAGDPHAFEELFRRHKDRMWAVALRTTRDPELAADCVQDGFIAAYRRAGSFRGESAVTTWLHRIVVNACLDRLRRRRPQAQLPEHDLADRHDEHGRTELRLDLEEALGRLPEGQRAALVLVDMHAVPVAEAAVILGVAEGTIKSRCARGRAALAASLGLVPRD